MKTSTRSTLAPKLSVAEIRAMWIMIAGFLLLVAGGGHVLLIDVLKVPMSVGRMEIDPWAPFFYTQRFGNGYLGICILGIGGLLNWRAEDKRAKQMAH